ncbi:MAG: epoxyqueuosine reductase QueH [Candidatus Gastranaerophilales bacterium]|nr:epoxyqueuosine reductase QueH [Candidatus Gastranaerophilales bacterium]
MSGKESNKKILLHTCCAICSGHPIKFLRGLGYEPVAYFFNPNIYPESEYLKRVEAQKKLCETLNCELIIEDYQPELYRGIMKGFENHPEGSERCNRCFELRLLRTAQKAKELEIEAYTTSLSSSPHKNFKAIRAIGNFFSDYFKINFMDFDFKKQNGFLHTIKLADELKLYRQNYCGCENSMRVKS